MLHLWYEQGWCNYFSYFRWKKTPKLSKNTLPNMTFGIIFTTFSIYKKKTPPISLVFNLILTPKFSQKTLRGSQQFKVKERKEMMKKFFNGFRTLFKECNCFPIKSLKKACKHYKKQFQKQLKSILKTEDSEDKLDGINSIKMKFYKFIFLIVYRFQINCFFLLKQFTFDWLNWFFLILVW